MVSLTQEVLKVLSPPPQLTVSEWADKYRFLSAEGAAEPGKWKTARAPYQREIMDTLSDPKFPYVVVMSSAQVGKTSILENTIAYDIHLDPSPILVLMPTLEIAEAFSKERLAPMLRDTPALADKIKSARARDSGNTLLSKKFPGGILTIAGANSPASLASRSIRKIRFDEADRYPDSAGTEGDPIRLATKRTAAFWNRQIFICSTPGLKATSRIYQEWIRSDQRHFLVPCPHCGFEQALEWERIKYPGKGTNSPECNKAVYVCENCDETIPVSFKESMLHQGKWRPTASSEGIAGFHLNELYSPWRSWTDVALDYESARKDVQQYQVWVNTSLGLPYEGDIGEKFDWETLWDRVQRSNYKTWEIPEEVLVITAGVDVQIDRLEVAVWGWGKGEQSWLIAHEVILGNPIKDEVWKITSSLLSKKHRHSLGGDITICTTMVDSGFLSEDVYRQVRRRKNLRWYAIKGKGGDRVLINRPSWQEVNYQGIPIKRGVELYTLGVDKAKSTLYARSHIAEPGHKFMNLPRDIEQDWCKGFCSEIKVIKHRGGRPYYQWETIPGRHNEPLDCSVYAYCAAVLAGTTRVDWDKIQKKLVKTEDEDKEKNSKSKVKKTGGNRPSKNWIKNW